MNELTLSEIWKSPEWKKQAATYSENKPCAWCGANPGDTYTTRKGKTRKLGFSVHHIEKHKWGLSLYNQVKNKLFREYYKKHISKPVFLFPAGLSKTEYRKQTKFDWEKAHQDEITEAFQEEKTRILRDYMNLTDENAVVLCNRCHYAREKGFVLCKICGKGYHKPKYMQCWSCKQNREDGVVKDES